MIPIELDGVDPVDAMVAAVPELAARLEETSGIPGPASRDVGLHAALQELAGLVALLLQSPWEHEDVLRRSFEVVEDLVRWETTDVTTPVAFGFLDGLDPAALDAAQPWLGPATAGLLGALEAGELDEGELDEGELDEGGDLWEQGDLSEPGDRWEQGDLGNRGTLRDPDERPEHEPLHNEQE